MNDKPAVEIAREELASPTARALIQELNAELQRQYPEPGATHFRLDEAEIGAENGAFLVARIGERPIGCGAVRRLDHHTAEIKRMYVSSSVRGQGVGRHILTALENEALRLGCRRMWLETGTRQTAALHLYRRTGYVVIPAYGEYVGSPLSVCMGKDL